jgi:hypothetical protein
MRRQRGILLLPVALTLALVGILAYTMTRDGSMAVSSVDAGYETDMVRYLAEGGVQLARWQNERVSCSSELNFGSVEMPDEIGSTRIIGTIKSGTIKREGKNTLNITLSAKTPDRPSGLPPAEYRVDERKVTLHKLADQTTVTLNGSGGNDTTIKVDLDASQGSDKELELTDDRSHAVLRFSLPGDMDYATILSAQLKLVQSYTDSTQPGFVAVHRVTRDWGSNATWTTPWATKGGDYIAAPTARVAIAPDLKEYVVPLEGLVQSWANKTIDDKLGILLKPSGLLNARFHSLDATLTSNKPKLVVRYLPRC